MDSFEAGLVVVIAAIVTFFVWVAIEDGKQMDREKAAFYELCLPHRQSYDCDMQWKTYEAAHNAELAASAAMGAAAGASVNAGVK